jgi:putative DNA primase/helicase
MRAKTADLARGKWPSILAAIGVPKEHLTNRHGPCPLCRGGKDRFRFDDKDGRGTFFCSQCADRGGDGIEFVKRFLGVEFKEACAEVDKHLGAARPIKIRQGPDERIVRQEIVRAWRAAKPLGEVRAAADWWRWRVGFVPDCADLLATPALRCPGAGEFAAMLALIRNAEGKAINMHRTFLGRDGRKAPIDEPRRVMPLPMPEGSAVRLFPHGDTLGIAEGIETAVAAMALFKVPCWAALTANRLEAWEPPSGVRVIVFGDNDANFAGQAAAFNLAKRLRVRKIDAEVRLPPAPGTDWNDVLMAQADKDQAA